MRAAGKEEAYESLPLIHGEIIVHRVARGAAEVLAPVQPRVGQQRKVVERRVMEQALGTRNGCKDSHAQKRKWSRRATTDVRACQTEATLERARELTESSWPRVLSEYPSAAHAITGKRSLDSREGKKEYECLPRSPFLPIAALSIQFDVRRHLGQKLAGEGNHVPRFVSTRAELPIDALGQDGQRTQVTSGRLLDKG